jgi:hypothetical protein
MIGKERHRYEGILHKPRLDYMLMVTFVVLMLWFIVIATLLLE